MLNILWIIKRSQQRANALLLPLAILISCPAFAADPLNKPQDLLGSFKASMIRSETMADQLEQVQQAEERIRQAIGSVLPKLSLTASYLLQEQPNNSASGFFPSSQPYAAITATQPLFQGFREFAALRQSKDLKKAQDETARQARVQLWNDVSQNYFTILSLEKDLFNLRTNLAYYDKRIAELKGRMKIGRSRESEVLTTQASMLSVESDIESTIGQIGVARETYAFLTGLSKDTKLDDNVPLPNELEPMEKYLSTIQSRPDVQAAKYKNQAGDEGIAIARGAHLPSVGLTADYYAKRYGSTEGINWDVQATLTFPIYSGGTIQSQVRQAASQSREAILAESQTYRSAEQSIRSLYINYGASQQQLRVLRQNREVTRKNYATQLRDYRLGLVTNLDVLQALTSAEDAERALDRAIYTAKLNYQQLLAAAFQNPVLNEAMPESSIPRSGG